MKLFVSILLLFSFICQAQVQPPYYIDAKGKKTISAYLLKQQKPKPVPQKAPIAYQGPLMITKAGTYTGNYRSDDSNTPAITISCYDSVIITGCNILSSGIAIKAYGGTKLNIHHNNIIGQQPTGNSQWGRALDDYHPQTLTFENNYVEHTGGLLVDHADENTRTAVIRYNLIRNTDKRRVDLSEGEHRAAILFNTVLPITGEIAWNQFENIPDSSWIEDNINFGNTGAPAASPYLIHDNYIKGAYAYPTTADHFTGSGITVEGAPSMNQYSNVSQNIKIYNNQVISTMNAGINVNAGHDIYVENNTIISSGMLPNGTKSQLFWGGGCVWNGSNVGTDVFKNIFYRNNTIGYVRDGVNTPLPNRQDWVVVSGSPINIQPGDNVSLPNPITLATEQAEYPKWLAKLAANKISIGNTTNVPIIIIDVPTSDTAIVLKKGQTLTGKITPVDATGTATTYKAGSVSVTSDATSAKVTKNTTDEKTFAITGVTAGKSITTVSLTTNSGKVLTKKVNVTVMDEATDLRISWQ